MRMNDRLMQTLHRNDIDRPKVLDEKQEIFKQLEPNIINTPEVKTMVHTELKKKKKKAYRDHFHARHIYTEMLEYVHTRFNPERKDNPVRAEMISAEDKMIIFENQLLRTPVELERRFLEILYIIILDSWNLPKSEQWLEILDFLGAFSPGSQLLSQDNELKDCYRFFLKISEDFGFS